ncbi:MAG: ATP-binding protein, partial [Cyanobacteria bacterium P01_D01_bin.36]
LLEQAAEAMTTMAQQHNIHLKTHTEPLSVWADPDYIIRTLTNLIGNAIKFSEPGTVIQLAVQSAPSQQKSAKPKKQQSNKQKHPPTKARQALFCVEDQGQGIPSDKLTQIFERFQQVDSSDSRKKGGTGLGLTICRKIIEQHGGRIWADSQIGVGSRFYFTVPLNPPTNLTPAASTKTERQAISIANSPSQLTYTEGL